MNCSRTAASGRISTPPSPPRCSVWRSASLAGIVLGVVAALLPPVAELLEPVMTLLNAIPRVVLAPLFVIWLGIDLASKVALAFILVAVVIFFTVFNGIRQVDRKLVERIVTLGGGRWDLVRHVYLPSVAAWVLGNLKIAVGFAFTGACVGEFVAASRGLGYLLSFAQSDLQRRADVRTDLPDHGGGAADLRYCGASGKISAALELSAAIAEG